MKYYESLPENAKQSLFSTMRDIGARSERYMQAGRDLAPRGGAIAVGGGAFEQTLKGEVLASYLRGLRNGATPAAALDAAMTERTAFVTGWNRQRGRDYILHRAADAEQSLLDDAHRCVLRAVGHTEPAE